MKAAMKPVAAPHASLSAPCGGGGYADLVREFSLLRSELTRLRAEVQSQREEIASLRSLLIPRPSCPGEEELPAVPETAWQALEQAGIVDAGRVPTGSRTEAAVLAHVLGEAFGIKGWAPFERRWRIPMLRNAWQRALCAQKTSDLLSAYAKLIGC